MAQWVLFPEGEGQQPIVLDDVRMGKTPQWGTQWRHTAGQFLLLDRPGSLVLDAERWRPDNLPFPLAQLSNPVRILLGEPGDRALWSGLAMVTPAWVQSGDDTVRWELHSRFANVLRSSIPWRHYTFPGRIQPLDFIKGLLGRAQIKAGFGATADPLMLAESSELANWWRWPHWSGTVGQAITDLAQAAGAIPYADWTGKVGMRTVVDILASVEGQPGAAVPEEDPSRWGLLPRYAPWGFDVSGPDGVDFSEEVTLVSVPLAVTQVPPGGTGFAATAVVDVPLGNDVLAHAFDRTPEVPAGSGWDAVTVTVEPLLKGRVDRVTVTATASQRQRGDDPYSVAVTGQRVTAEKVQTTRIASSANAPSFAVKEPPAWLDYSSGVDFAHWLQLVSAMNRTTAHAHLVYRLDELVPGQMRPGYQAQWRINPTERLQGVCLNAQIITRRGEADRVAIDIMDLIGAGAIAEAAPAPQPSIPPPPAVPPEPPERVPVVEVPLQPAPPGDGSNRDVDTANQWSGIQGANLLLGPVPTPPDLTRDLAAAGQWSGIQGANLLLGNE